MDPSCDPWFAGFAAGEGCFTIQRGSRPRHAEFRPRFAIGLRADDAAILGELQLAFGGTICVAPGNKVVWTVAAKRDLDGIVSYFERFPLRARKQNDFVLWAQAVRLYAKHGCRAEGLGELKQRLEGQRVFVSPVIEECFPVTRRDVARLASVSERTVKRVLSPDGSPVSAATRSRVEAAIQELGFVSGGRQKPRLRLVA